MRCWLKKTAAASGFDSVSTSERKTGLYVPNVETVGLVRDERGRLRLTG
jgi:hypothetical protein